MNGVSVAERLHALCLEFFSDLAQAVVTDFRENQIERWDLSRLLLDHLHEGKAVHRPRRATPHTDDRLLDDMRKLGAVVELQRHWHRQAKLEFLGHPELLGSKYCVGRFTRMTRVPTCPGSVCAPGQSLA